MSKNSINSFIKLAVKAIHSEFKNLDSKTVDEMINKSKIIEKIQKDPEMYMHMTSEQIADRMQESL